MLLKGKNIIVTGCASGIGKATLEELAKNGANLWACARKETGEFAEFIKYLQTTYYIEVMPLFFDFQEEASLKAAIQKIQQSKKSVDGLVNNAGIIHNALFQMTSEAKLRELFEVNFFKQFMFTQYIVKFMIRQQTGVIVNISSSSALDGTVGHSAYGASKAAILGLTQVLAAELATYKIRVNAVVPGITNTKMIAHHMTEKVIQETVEQTKLKRIGEPQEIANTIVFLLSDLSSYITGQIIRVDGGLN